MTSQPDLYTLSATQVLDLIQEDFVTVEEYARSLLDRVKCRDSTVKAWAYFDPQIIIDQATSLDRLPREERGPLHGVAIGVKDVFSTKDMPTKYGSLVYEGDRPGTDSAPVDILRRAGALIFGKTTTSEFTFPNNGPETTNPHDRSRTPGGSSAGSAAAVADFQVPLSIGTQTGGSVIRPASYTGVWAMKPSFGTVSMEGVKPCAPSLDTFGFFARDVRDLELMATVFALKDDEIPRNIPSNNLQVALIRTPQWPKAGPGTIAAMEKARLILHNNGILVKEVEFPEDFADPTTIPRLTTAIINCEAQVSFLKDYRKNSYKLHPENRAVIENTESTHKEQCESFDKLNRLQEFISGVVLECSVLLAPSCPDVAPEGIDDFGPSTFNSIWTALHMPVINVPAFIGESGLPIGISLAIGRFHDQQLLAICKTLGEQLMAAGDWRLVPHGS